MKRQTLARSEHNCWSHSAFAGGQATLYEPKSKLHQREPLRGTTLFCVQLTLTPCLQEIARAVGGRSAVLANAVEDVSGGANDSCSPQISRVLDLATAVAAHGGAAPWVSVLVSGAPKTVRHALA